jgi:hypothetical protein
MKSTRLAEGLITLLVFLLIYSAYLRSGNNVTADSAWSIHTSMSLLREGNADLNEYRGFLKTIGQTHAYAAEAIDGHIYNFYPIGSSIAALPLVAVINQFARSVYGIDLQEYLQHSFPEPVELLIAAFLVALTAVILYRSARLYLPISLALLLTFIFAFCTSAWSTASRVLWQHTASLLMLSLTLYLTLLARRRPALIQFISIPLALSYTIRPTNSISIVVFTLFVFIAYRRYLVRYLLWALLVAVPFFVFNESIYQALLSPYYRLYQEFSLATLVPALIGQWLSPSRGLLIYSPVLLLAVFGLLIKIRRKQIERLDAYLLGIVVLHWIAISIWPVWWGGWSYGPRMFTDMLPYFFYFMIPVFVQAPRATRGQKAVFAAGTLLLVAWSFAVHYRGANDLATLEWNRKPVNVDDYPDRLWDWRDAQFARGLTWGAPIDLALSGVPILYFDSATYPLLGTNQLRLRKFDVSSAVIAPPGSSWLAISDQQVINPELAHLFAGVEAAAHFQTTTEHAPYSLYQFDLHQRLSQTAQQSEQTVFVSSTLQPVSVPVQFGEIVQLIGYSIKTSQPPASTAIVTYWQVLQPIDAPLRLFVHALDANGQIAAQDDRLDVPSKGWRSGDLIAQVSRLSLPADAGPVWIEAGWYDPESGERLPVLLNGQTIDQRVLLNRVEIKQ